MELTLVLAPFECPLCEYIKTTLPSYCKERGWKLIMVEDGKNREYDVEYYPHIQIKINDTIVDTIEGISDKEIMKKLKQYN